jgi:mRNA-degrading endonuclease toxin of MazEF toxin-antitoxin module
MSKELTKDEVIIHKKSAIKMLNNLLEHYINSDDKKSLKKANLLAYWLEDFSNYIYKEESYSPVKQIRYKRGNIIKVNFGFRVGKEYGGLHYAVVISKNNPHNAHVLTVVPLTSGTQEDTYKNDVYLGTELYNKLSDRHSSLINKHNSELEKIQEIRSSIQSTLELIQQMIEQKKDSESILDNIKENYGHIENLQKEYFLQQKQIEHDIQLINKNQAELNKLKIGSIALIEQITTIDKARIYIPRKTTDALYGISFSADKMDLINDAIKAQFIF